MRVRVLYFGVLRERFRSLDEVVELSDGVAVGELLRILRERTSNDAMVNAADTSFDERLWRSLAVAVNREYSAPEAVLRDGDEVALLPPVSGGSFAEGERRASLASAGVLLDFEQFRVLLCRQDRHAD